jgi:uncharacterized membrane protein YbhN (UPF0104 family)
LSFSRIFQGLTPLAIHFRPCRGFQRLRQSTCDELVSAPHSIFPSLVPHCWNNHWHVKINHPTMPLPTKSLDAVKRLWPALKWGMFLLVLVFVARHGWHLWTGFDQHARPLKWGWLLLAVATSLCAWLPSLWFWRQLMAALGATAPWPQAARAYYCGHLGKYVPGKGLAIVIRSALLKDCRVPGTTAALTVTIEALTCMWVGLLVAISLYPTLKPGLPPWIAGTADHPVLRWCVFAGVACSGPIVFALMMRSHGPLANWFHGSFPVPPTALDASADRSIPAIWLSGVVGFLASWSMQGLTLGLTIQAVSTEPWNWADWPFWTGSATLALVGGFVVIFAPGGLGVREGLLMELLERQLGSREAVLVALLLRGVSLAGEILVSVALYYGIVGKPRPKGEPGV